MSVASRTLLICMLLSVTAGCAGLRHTATEPNSCDIAQRYVDAANRSDPELVAPWLHQEVVAIFLSADTDHAETISGRSAVLEAVRTYKDHCPSCASSMTCHLQTPSAAYVTETVEFEGQSGPQQQRAPLVIEIEAQRIVRIIYFPSG